MKRLFTAVPALLLLFLVCSAEDCNPTSSPSSDDTQAAQQERILREGTSQVGMPAIKNFRERKQLKDIFELRDQVGFTTYTYVWPELSKVPIFFCDSIGYGIPYATQFTNPQKIAWAVSSSQAAAGLTLPQADPNGLFSPASAEGTWIMCKDPERLRREARLRRAAGRRLAVPPQGRLRVEGLIPGATCFGPHVTRRGARGGHHGGQSERRESLTTTTQVPAPNHRIVSEETD